MGFFKEKTELQELIEEYFNPDPENPYTYIIEDEGEYVDINQEILNGDNSSSRPILSKCNE